MKLLSVERIVTSRLKAGRFLLFIVVGHDEDFICVDYQQLDDSALVGGVKEGTAGYIRVIAVQR